MRRSVCVLLLLACLGSGGCAVYYTTAKFLGLMGSPELDASKQLPEDFHLSVDVRDVADPPTDYVLEFDRSGKASYDVTVRAPRRKQQSGEFEISEEQIKLLWKTVATVKFDKLDHRYPGKGEGPDVPRGVQKYYVYASKTDFRVESHYQANDDLELIRKTAVAMVPPDAMKAAAANALLPGDKPKEFIADMGTRFFHLPDCPKLKDIPAANRQPFATTFEALNYGFQPCPECQPTKTR
jgi:hypothetical protein